MGKTDRSMIRFYKDKNWSYPECVVYFKPTAELFIVNLELMTLSHGCVSVGLDVDAFNLLLAWVSSSDFTLILGKL